MVILGLQMNKNKGCLHCASPAQQLIEASEVEFGVPLRFLYTVAKCAMAKLKDEPHPSCCLSQNHSIFSVVLDLMTNHKLDDLHILNAVRCRQAFLATTSATVESRGLFFHELKLAHNVYWCDTNIEDPFDHLEILATVADPLPTKLPVDFDYNWPTRHLEDSRFLSPCPVSLNLIGNINEFDLTWSDIEESDDEVEKQEEEREEGAKEEEEEEEEEEDKEEEDKNEGQGKSDSKDKDDDEGASGGVSGGANEGVRGEERGARKEGLGASGGDSGGSSGGASGEERVVRSEGPGGSGGASRANGLSTFQDVAKKPSSKRENSGNDEIMSSKKKMRSCLTKENEVNFKIDSEIAGDNVSVIASESAADVRVQDPRPGIACGPTTSERSFLQGIEEALMIEKNKISSPFPKVVAEFKIKTDGVDMISISKDETVSLVIKEEIDNSFFDLEDDEAFESAVVNFEKRKLEERQNKQLKLYREKPVEYIWKEAKVSKIQRNTSQGFVSRLGLEFQAEVDQWLSQKEYEVKELMSETPFYSYKIVLKWQI